MSQSIVLNWTLPSARTDGTPLAPAQIAEVNVFLASATPPTKLASLPGTATTYNAGEQSPGSYSFGVSVTDTDGNVSSEQTVAATVAPPVEAAPNPVTGLTATVGP